MKSNSHPRRTVGGVNDCTTLRPDIASLFSKESLLKSNEVTPYSNKQALFDCPKGHSWLARVSTVTSGGRCTYCAGLAVLEGFNDLETVYPELVESYSNNNNKLPASKVYSGGAKSLLWYCKVCKGEWLAQARQRAAGTGCPYCSSSKLLKGFNDFETIFPERAKLWSANNIKIPSQVMPFTNKTYFFTCFKHGDWKTSPNKVSSGGGCPKCAQNSFISKGERELSEFIESLGFKTILGDRVILKGFEIDVLCEDVSLGFEFNGDYWHSDKVIQKVRDTTAKEYHQKKLDEAAKRGIDLFFVWDSDWKFKSEEIREAIKRVLADRTDIDSILQILSKD